MYGIGKLATFPKRLNMSGIKTACISLKVYLNVLLIIYMKGNKHFLSWNFILYNLRNASVPQGSILGSLLFICL